MSEKETNFYSGGDYPIRGESSAEKSERERGTKEKSLFGFLTPEEARRYRLAWNLGRWDFICGTGKVKNLCPDAVAHYRSICNEIIIAARNR